MKTVWCWRCKRKVPMLDERECESISSAFRSGALPLKRRLRAESRRVKKSDEADLYREVVARYHEMTGVSDVDPREILKHRLSLVGPPCENCGKELRTPRAKKCLECGHVRSSPIWTMARKRVILIAAAILASRTGSAGQHLAFASFRLRDSRRLVFAERIMREIDNAFSK